MYSYIPIVSHVCEYHVWIFLPTYAFVVYLRKLQCCVFFTSFTKCTCYIFCSMILDFTSYKLGINKPCMEKSCRLGSIPAIVSTNHVKFVVFFCLLLSWHFFLWYFFHGIYIWCILYTHTPCLKCWWYVSHVKITWCLCKKVHADRPRLTIFGMVWLTKLSSQSSLNIGVLSGMLHVTVKFLISEFFVPSISL